MSVENIYKWIFKWLKYNYPREYCFDNIINIINNEDKDFLLKNRYVNEILYDLGKDYLPLQSILLPSLLKNKNIYYNLLLNKCNIVDLEKNMIFIKYSKL
jgi:hypothetical protein